ncbi:MAG: Adenylosuccinate lyase C-terminus [Rhodobacteraceae bacterium HLUCCO18]|nr:MAG: Adenylosuccinate lyase C-terminus [Rhodobacteraceae bacterium HLUCCO18]
MAQLLDDRLGLIHAEALSFALAPTLGRAEAQAQVKTLAAQARETGAPLPDLVAQGHPGTNLPDLSAPATLGTAPRAARAFAGAARTRAAAIERGLSQKR